MTRHRHQWQWESWGTEALGPTRRRQRYVYWVCACGAERCEEWRGNHVEITEVHAVHG